MDLKQRLQSEMKEAMKQKDTLKKNVITMIRAAILQHEKDNQTTLDEQGVIDVISRQLKQRRDALADFEKGARQDLVDLTNAEIAQILTYLPAQLTDEELTEMISEAIERLGVKDMKDFKNLMADLAPKTKGSADGKKINEIARSLIGK